MHDLLRTVNIIKIEFQDILLVDFADISDVHDVTDPLTKVKAGLVSNDDTPVTLLEAHIRAKLIDLAGEVNIHFTYINTYTLPSTNKIKPLQQELGLRQYLSNLDLMKAESTQGQLFSHWLNDMNTLNGITFVQLYPGMNILVKTASISHNLADLIFKKNPILTYIYL